MKALSEWRVEDEQFWEKLGQKVAWKNLAISVPCLLSAFAIWQMWSVFIVQMQNLGFPFSKIQLYALPAIAGLSGATLRITNSFVVSIAGGRNTVALSTMLMIIPTGVAGIFLNDRSTPYGVFLTLALLSGIGGGNFASSMSNITLFFPKRLQGTALGINAGLGNLGVSVVQFVSPLLMGIGLFGGLGGSPLTLTVAQGGKEVGSPVWLQNGAMFWVPFLALLVLAAWWKMDNLPSMREKSTTQAIGEIIWLNFIGLATSGIGVILLIGVNLTIWLVLPITIGLTLLVARYLSGSEVQHSLSRQYRIFSDKHTWVMTILYLMTFGSFIGYSAVFPKLIQDVFANLPDGSPNPNAPNPFHYAFLGPLVGSLIRPLGGWISDRWGGARVTHWDTLLLIGAAIGLAIVVKGARLSPHPEEFFLPFLLIFLLLFIGTGIGNGSTFRMIPNIFPPDRAGSVLGWTSAVAAYGSFIIPRIFGSQIEVGHPEVALYGFTAFYFICFLLNWFYYVGPTASVKP